MPSQTFTRRGFLKAGCTLAASSALPLAVRASGPAAASIMTVTGAIKPGALGLTLPHEHVLVDFIGAEGVSRDRYNPEEVFKVALPYLVQLRRSGCRSLFECTPAWLGRDAALLQRLSKASGLQIITNTGYYSAVGGKYLPPHAYTEPAEALAERWVQEWQDGIDGTGIRPGFIKISVDGAPLKDYNQKIVKAAALCHLRSGLIVAAHTGNGAAALEEIRIMRENGAGGSAFVWVHAQNEKDPKIHLEAIRLGAWVEFDGLNDQNVDDYVALLQAMKTAGHLNRILVSHDAGWYHVGEQGGGNYRSYNTVFEKLLPALKQAGFTARETDQLLLVNPREAFSIRVRKV